MCACVWGHGYVLECKYINPLELKLELVLSNMNRTQVLCDYRTSPGEIHLSRPEMSFDQRIKIDSLLHSC